MSLKSYLSPQAYSSAQAEKARRFLNRVTPKPYDGDDVVEFINREMVIPETGKPLELHPEHADVLHEMSQRDANGLLKYSLWLFGAPKKTGKTAVAAGVALWQAMHEPHGEVYIIGNDLKQADNRMAQAIRYAINHNPRFARRARIVKNTIYLENETKIESIPVDPKGEAGMNPTGLFWTEAWGAMGNKPELLWSEAALSPTRKGHSFKFVESYAGFEGQSTVLERLYNNIIKEGVKHPNIPEVYSKGTMVGYWCTRRIMEWQLNNPEYYAQEATDKTPQEYARIHGNEWSTSSQAFVPSQWWEACQVASVPDLGRRGVVMGVDAAVENDCFAVVLVSTANGKVQVRYCKVWTPDGGQIQFSEVEDEIKRLFKAYNVIEVAYDPYQMASTAQRLADFAFWKEFTQGAPRLIADKMLYDKIQAREIEYAGEFPELKQHILNADRKPAEDKLRIIKRNANLKIDACVALSMCVNRAMYYNL